VGSGQKAGPKPVNRGKEVYGMKEMDENKRKKKAFFYSKGVTYFSKKTERSLFFILTIIMLLWGIFTKLDVF